MKYELTKLNACANNHRAKLQYYNLNHNFNHTITLIIKYKILKT